ncbi:MAG: hypothetical protein ACJ74U_13980 [Jatrophihabitantaceae bacterium]
MTSHALSRRTFPPRLAALLAILAIGAAAVVGTGDHRVSATTQTAAKPKIFAFYYLWWSKSHWVNSLGSQYPVNSTPLPLPARLAATGCNPVTNYAGNTLTDVPTALFSQDDPGRIALDVRQAAAAGLSGFIVNWAGSGTASQLVTSNPYNRRLQAVVDAVHAINRAGVPFKLWISYKASASILPLSSIVNDLAYLRGHYAADAAFDRSQSARPTLIWQGSRKYSAASLQLVASRYRSTFRILGDESSWSAARAAYLDGDAYYWSSQDPYRNPQSFSQLATLANAVRSSVKNPDGSRKAWIAPLSPGYDKQLAGGTNCVPRNGGQTMRTLFAGNARTVPDAWGLISWNEVVEGTYIEPLQRYGQQDLNVVHALATGT